MDIQKPSPHEFERHSGAAFLIGTSAISDDRPALGDVLQVFLDLSARHSNGAWQPATRLTPIHQAARVNKSEALPAIDSFHDFSRCKLGWFHLLHFAATSI
jgi:hypothetical protein